MRGVSLGGVDKASIDASMDRTAVLLHASRNVSIRLAVMGVVVDNADMFIPIVPVDHIC
ncbi:hypothetical protein HDE80_001789 [Rhodanobacter sp. A1T4]|nr:hypothetical protein [Rhodanobacter sp. A1T4]